jgi:RHS repeat-associated protein
MSEPAEADILSTAVTDYVGNKVYKNGQLKMILTEEGYIEKTGSTYNTYYYLKDHLGSVRVVLSAQGTVVQATNYYPSGTVIADNPRRTDQGVQPYKYNGKELDRTHNLDFYNYEARSFDPTLMRFTSVDPMAEKYYNVSPYAYCANNPVNVIDPNGKELIFITKNNQYTYNNGHFWTSKGFVYTPDKGSTMERVLSVYQKIEASGDKILINQLETLDKSDKKHFMGEGERNTVRAWELDKTISEQQKMISEGKAVNTRATFNFSEDLKKKYKESTGIENSDFTTVAHEMQHQYDYDQGKMSDANGKGAKDPSEIRAVKNENRARKIENLPLRTKYSEEDIEFKKLK